MKDLFKKIPEDIRQAICSLCVSSFLIIGSLLMLGSYVASMEDNKKDVGVMANADKIDENGETEHAQKSDTP